MKITAASHLSDPALVEEVGRLAGHEREATAAFIVHLAEFDARRLYTESGFASTYRYCVEALHLSEDAAWNRIEAARMARAYPVVLDMLVEGTLSPTTARMIRPYLTPETHAELFEAAAGKSKREVEKLLARLFPQPDIAPSIHPLLAPVPARPESPSSAPLFAEETDARSVPPVPATLQEPAVVPVSSAPPIVRPLSAERYEIRFTVPAETQAKLRRAQDLLAGSISSGDLAQVFDRALTLLVADLERKKAGLTTRPRSSEQSSERSSGRCDSRYIPPAVRREVWKRDGGRCAFVASSGRPCHDTRHLEYHHGPVPYGVGGRATVDNIHLLCRAHNRYESERFYGPEREYGGIDLAREAGRETARPRRGGVASPVPERVGVEGPPM